MTESWIESTWKFMSENGIQLKDETPEISLARENDKILMEVFIENGYKGTELRRLNSCRLHLQSTTLADITSGDGRYITKDAWEVKFPETACRHNGYTWPNWETVGAASRTIWKEAPRQCFCRHMEYYLDNPVGVWTQPASDNWKSFNREQELLWKDKDNEWYKFEPLGRTLRQQRYNIIPTKIERPTITGLLRTTVTIHQGHLEASGVASTETRTSPDERNFEGRHKQWLYYTQTSSTSTKYLIKDIRQGNFISVSDGSYKEDKGLGTAAWIIESACGN